MQIAEQIMDELESFDDVFNVLDWMDDEQEEDENVDESQHADGVPREEKLRSLLSNVGMQFGLEADAEKCLGESCTHAVSFNAYP